jgi:hypothetical protein
MRVLAAKAPLINRAEVGLVIAGDEVLAEGLLDLGGHVPAARPASRRHAAQESLG